MTQIKSLIWTLTFLSTFWSWSLCLAETGQPGDKADQRPGQRPNIIFLLADNIQSDHFGYMGHPFIKTPSLDKMARNGVVFQNAFDTTPLCSPSRASILSGAYASNHGVKTNHTAWQEGRKTFLELMDNSGYNTAFIGKWHMPGKKGLPDLPFLETFVSFSDRSGQGRYFDCPLIVNGKPTPSKKTYLTEEMTDYAIEFMNQQTQAPEADKKPFLMYLSYKNAHPPYKAPKEVAGRYKNAKVDLPARDFWYPRTNGVGFHGTLFGSYKSKYRKYGEVITALDQQIGRLMDELDKAGLKENTMVVFMADNGVGWGEHFYHGLSEPWEEIIKLPFIVQAPWLVNNPGTRREQMVLNIDIAPTFMTLAGLEPPSNMDGKSFIPLLTDPSTQGRKAWLLEFWRFFPRSVPTYTGVRTDQYKYVEYVSGRDNQLFDLKNDPGEKNNIYDTSQGRELLPKLKQMMTDLSTGAQL